MDRRAPCGCDVMSLAAGQPHDLSCSTRIPRDGAIVGLATSGLASEALRRISESIATGKPAGEIKGLATSGLASADRVSARDLVTPQEFQVLIADAQKGKGETYPVGFYDCADPVDPEAGLKADLLNATGVSLEAVRGVTEAARSLKSAELAFRDAQQVYAEAVKRLSEEAVK